jgi:hypothetical protein
LHKVKDKRKKIKVKDISFFITYSLGNTVISKEEKSYDPGTF